MHRVRVGALATCLVLSAACGGKSETASRRSGPAEFAPNAASCTELPEDCGPQADEDCCASPLVTGGMFYRSYDDTTLAPPGPYTSTAFPATVSDFRLDRRSPSRVFADSPRLIPRRWCRTAAVGTRTIRAISAGIRRGTRSSPPTRTRSPKG